MKKVYDRPTKQWVTEEERLRRHRKRQTCKGGAEHDWVKVLPWGVEALPNYRGDPEIYYTYEREIAEFHKQKIAELEKEHGVKVKMGYWSKNDIRQLVCSVCGKKDYMTI